MTEPRIPMSYLRARYWIETSRSLEAAAESLCGEQSSGTFLAIPGESDALKARSGARIVCLNAVPGAPTQGDLVVEWPLDNMGVSLPNVLATVAGNLFELKQFSGLRLLDVEFPADFLTRYQGPQFGVAGTRKLSGVYDMPLIGTIVKPSVGYSPDETAALVSTLCEAGIDFVKDDELQANGPHCPLEARIEAVMRVVNDHAERAGKKVMFAFNITGEIDQMLRGHDRVLEAGGTCVMVSVHSIGLPAMVALRKHSQLPIHAHRNGWGMYSGSVSYVAWQKFWRLAGADHLHVNGLRNKFKETDESVIASARECARPMFAERGCEAMPVFSSGQTVHQAADTYRAMGSADLIFAAGGGLMAHPDGVAAGVRSLRQAWEVAMRGGEPPAELRRAREFFKA